MKPGVSSLNPYAASYIPLSQRNANGRNFVTSKDYKSGNESTQFGAHEQLHSKVSLDYNSHAMEKSSSPEVLTVKSHPIHGYASSPQNMNQATEKQIVDEEFDMGLEYLQMAFPGLSDQSITDVYVANKGDLEATIDMLNQLESHTFESSESLPDTLDIGDVSEFGSSADCMSLKLKNVEGETSAASSSS